MLKDYDLDIILPTPEEMIAGEKISKFGENIEVSVSGLVTGTLYNTTFDAFSSLPDEKKGHYFVFKLPVQDDVETMSFYKDCGFKYSHIVPDFFTANYDHPIVENGITLKDMVYLRKELSV